MKFITALLTAALSVLLFRTLAFTIYSVPVAGIDSRLQQGDRVMVNRWSYGLRSGDGRMFRHARLLPHDIKRGDIVAFNPPADSVLNHLMRRVCLGHVIAVPGDTIRLTSSEYAIPRRKIDCPLLGDKYYLIATRHNQERWLVAERMIIGRAFLVLYNKESTAQPFSGFRKDRAFKLIK